MKKSKMMAPDLDAYDGIPDDEKKFLAEELMDADIASTMGTMMISHPKMEQSVTQASQHPGAAAALAVQTVLGIREKFISKDLPFSERIWAAENGVLRGILDDIAEQAAHNGGEFSEDAKEDAYAKGLKMLQMYEDAGNQASTKNGKRPVRKE